MQNDLPWSYEIVADAVPADGQHVELIPDAETLSRLAKAASVLAVHHLKADLALRRMADDGIEVSGKLSGTVRQTCVVSLEEFDNPISETFTVDFAAKPESLAATEDEEEIEDMPDPIIDGKIDLGALVTEVLILAVDPYPRKPGVSFEAKQAEGTEADPERNPFERLSGLKDKLKK